MAASTYQSIERTDEPTTVEGEFPAIMKVPRDLRPSGGLKTVTSKDSRGAAQLSAGPLAHCLCRNNALFFQTTGGQDRIWQKRGQDRIDHCLIQSSARLEVLLSSATGRMLA